MLYSCYFCRGVHLTLMKTVSNSKLSCTCKFSLDWEKSVGTWAVHVQFHSSFPGPFWAIQKPCAVQISDLRLGADPIFFFSLETGQGKQCIFDAWDIDHLDCALCLSICPWNPIDFFCLPRSTPDTGEDCVSQQILSCTCRFTKGRNASTVPCVFPYAHGIPWIFFVCKGLHLTPVNTVSHNKY